MAQDRRQTKQALADRSRPIQIQSHSRPLALLPRPPRRNVKTGCLTCKVRKVKCDEAKPACLRCRSTGRNCDGYWPTTSSYMNQGIPEDSKRSSPTQFRPGRAYSIFQTPQNNPATWKEIQTFEFIRLKTLPALSGYFSADFWGRLLSRPNELDSTLWHAVLAIGSFHEESEIRSIAPWQRPPDRTPKRNIAFALYHYTASIRCLREKLASQKLSLSTVLTACILFVYLEFLRGDLDAATAQIHSGLNIIRDFIQTGRIYSPSLDTKKDPSNSLIPQFYSLGIFGTLFGRPPSMPAFKYVEHQQPLLRDGFESLTEARLGIMRLISVVVPYVQAATIRYRHLKAHPTESSYTEKLQLEASLESWLEAFNRLLEKSSFNDLDSRAAKVLMVQHTIASIWVRASFATTESAFDRYSVDFARIVLLSEAITSPRSQGQASASFTFELGIIPPLYWTAVKCRDPLIRRRAVHLLVHETARQEGLWFARETASVALVVIELEEKRPYNTPISENDRQNWPPEAARIRRRADPVSEDPLPTWGRFKEGTISDVAILNDSLVQGRYVTFEMWDEDAGKPRLLRKYVRYLDCD